MTDQKPSEPEIDRTNWPSGPWDSEPDRIEWRMSEPPGYPCLIVRGPLGALCGYVGVPPGHPAHSKTGDEVEVSVHGGVTFADRCSGRVCHVPRPGEPEDVWWLGFDTGHAFDFIPSIAAGLGSLPGRNGVTAYVEWYADMRYRDVAYVRAEVEQLAAQLAQMAVHEHVTTEEPT
jgi:hypothetical protein